MTLPNPAIAFGGWYRVDHAYAGLRIQLVPFLGLVVLLLIAAAWLSFVFVALTVLLLALTAGLLYFLFTSYRANAQRIRTTFAAQHCQGELRPSGLWLSLTPGGAEIPWSAFARSQVFPTFVLLHSPGGDVTLLPREFFTPSDWRLAKRFLRTYVPSSGSVPRQIKTALVAFLAFALLATILFFATR